MKEIPWNKIIYLGQQTMISLHLFSVSWILGRFCNYKCSYCWPYARSDKLDYQTLEIYKKTIDNIKAQARSNGFNKFHWSFSGGEPTAYRQLPELIRYLDDTESSYQSIHMTTNLSPSSKWWKSWCQHTDSLQRRSITASYHDEFADEKEFEDKCLQLIDSQVYLTINQVMVPELFYQTLERCQRLSDRGINVTLKPMSDPTASYIVDGYTEDMLSQMRLRFPQIVNSEEIYQIYLKDIDGNEYLFDQAERFNAFGFNKFQDWHCNSGYQSVIIRGNEVKRGYSCHDQSLGTLDQGFKLFKESNMCKTPSCVSSADSKIPKIKLIKSQY